MKRFMVALCLLLALILCAAYADTDASTEHFCIDLPGVWYGFGETYTSANNETVTVSEVPNAYTEEQLDNARDSILFAFQCDYPRSMSDYLLDVRTDDVTVAGKDTKLLSYKSIYGSRVYCSLTWCDHASLYITYRPGKSVKSPMDVARRILQGIAPMAASDTMAPAEEESAEEESAEEEQRAFTVFERDGLQVELSGFAITDSGRLAVDVVVRNGSDLDISYRLLDVYLNGWKGDSFVGESVRANRNCIQTIILRNAERAGVHSVDDLRSLEFTLVISRDGTYEELYREDVAAAW